MTQQTVKCENNEKCRTLSEIQCSISIWAKVPFWANISKIYQMKALSEIFPVPKGHNSNDDPYVVIKRKIKGDLMLFWCNIKHWR